MRGDEALLCGGVVLLIGESGGGDDFFQWDSLLGSEALAIVIFGRGVQHGTVQAGNFHAHRRRSRYRR